MNDEQFQFAPFQAINQFMVPEYRQRVLQFVYSRLSQLSKDRSGKITNLTNRFVKLPGFRNSALAPLSVKVRSAGDAYERRSDFVAQILQGWAELQPELAQQIYDFLTARGWELLPVETDRTKLPGFMLRWPQKDSYDVLDQAYAEAYPEAQTDTDDFRLMVVWISGRLPYDMVDDEADEEEGEEDSEETTE
jgi:hypothetical protein